jgi:methionyl-tRNA synthetase
MRLILAIGNLGNKFFQDMHPWERIKTDKEHAHATVSLLTYLINNLAITMSPFMPDTSHSILTMLNRKECSWREIGTFRGLDGHKVNKATILHKKIDSDVVSKYKSQFGAV